MVVFLGFGGVIAEAGRVYLVLHMLKKLKLGSAPAMGRNCHYYGEEALMK